MHKVLTNNYVIIAGALALALLAILTQDGAPVPFTGFAWWI